MTSTTSRRGRTAVARSSRGARTVGRLIACTAAVLLVAAPFLLAAVAPRLAVLPAHAETTTVPPMPEPGPVAAESIDALIEPLPIVVRDLPDEPSRLAAADWDAALLLDPASSVVMIDHALQGVVPPPEAEDAVVAYVDALLFGAGYMVPEQVMAEGPGSEAVAAVAGLAGDPSNADRLNNLAVSLFALGASSQHADHGDALDGYGFAPPEVLRYHAVELLTAVDRAFPPNRAVRLNLAFLASAVPSPGGSVAAAIPPAEQVLADDPTDRAARLLLGSLEARRTDRYDGIDRAVAVLRPLLADPATEVLGHAAIGDAFLAAAAIRSEAPFLRRDLAWRAIEAYDRAIAEASHPGLFAGRATALALLGEASEAVAAQEQAVALAPESVALQLGLARHREAAGDFVGMLAAADRARRMVETGWNPRLANVRFVVAPISPTAGFVVPGDLGFLGYSVGSERDHAGFGLTWEGGAFVVSSDLIPRTDAPYLDSWRQTGPAPAVADEMAIAAAILLGGKGVEGPPTDPAVLLAVGKPLPADADPDAALATAQTAMRQAGRFDAAAALCRRLRTGPEAVLFDRIAILRCLGESAFLAGDPATAAAALGAASAAADNLVRSGGMAPDISPDALRLRAAAANEAAGRVERARMLYISVVAAPFGGPETVVPATAKLGELTQGEGNAAGAVGWYDLVLAMVESPDDPYWSGSVEAALLARTIGQRAHLNRGLARLSASQPGPESPPDCTGTNRAACEAAREDFAAALAVDPLDPVALLDAAWADRLLNEPEAARANLALAVAIDPTLFPALNDLGVLQAQVGDEDAARRSFQAALAAEPGYDLAAWNLGILDLRRGVSGLVPGEAWLQRAVSANGTLAGDDLTLKSDERIYRVDAGRGDASGGPWSFSRSYSLGAVALGATAVAVTLGGSLHALLLGKSSGFVTEHGPVRLNRAGSFLRAVLRRRLPRPVWRWWLAWEPWLVTLPVLALVTALPAWRADPSVGQATALAALLAAAVALAAHELGHALAARLAGARLAPAQWGPGVGLAILLLPLRMSSGPFVAQRVLGIDADRAWWVYLAGPAANLGVAVAAYAVYLDRPMPLLRVVVAAQLAAIGYAMLPFAPMDGSALKRRPILVAVVGVVIAVAGLLLAVGE